MKLGWGYRQLPPHVRFGFECPLGSRHGRTMNRFAVKIKLISKTPGAYSYLVELLLEQHATVPVTPGAGSSEFGLATSWGGGVGDVPFQTGFGRVCADASAVSPDCLCASDSCRLLPVRCRWVPRRSKCS